MERTSLAKKPCPIARAAEQLGDAWTLLVLRDVFLGSHRFAQLQEHLGIAPNILARRLTLLTRHGLLKARPYSRKPLRHAYTLTPKGEAALPVLLTLAAWGNAWLAPHGAPLVPIDVRTGRAVEPLLIDKRTGRPLVAGSVAVKAGPGAPRSLAASLRAPRVFMAGGRA
jgi:DNA-binding HxlR family transcriptional regulator